MGTLFQVVPLSHTSRPDLSPAWSAIYPTVRCICHVWPSPARRCPV